MSRAGGAPENLDPVRTKEEAKKRGTNGGKKSGEARRKKRDAKAAAKLILDLAVSSDNVEENLRRLGIPDEDFTNRVALMARLLTDGLYGNTRATELLLRTAGEMQDQVLAEKRYKDEKENRGSSSSVVDQWVSAVIVADKEETEGYGE